MKIFLLLGTISAALSVALGAFGAHALTGKIPEKYIEIWKTGVTYEMFHATGLLAIGLLMMKSGSSSLLTWAGWLMVVGTLLFSGSLYVLAVTQFSKLGMITPLGGVAFIAGWICLAAAVWKM